jgi:hypothetical protein
LRASYRNPRLLLKLLTLAGTVSLVSLANGRAAGAASFNIVNDPLYTGSGEISNERIIEVGGTSIVLATWDEQNGDGESVYYYGVSLDGSSFVRVSPASYELGLRYARFDPLVSVPDVDPSLAAGADVGLFIVQFVTQPLDAFRTQIEGLGGEVHHYVAQFAYLVEMTADVREQVEALPYVRWIGAYEPAYRLEEFMLENLAQAETAYPLLRYNIMVHTVEQKTIVASRISSTGGTVDNNDAGKRLIEATLTPTQLFEVVRWDEVLFADRWSPYETDMNIAREIGGANYLETVEDYTGEGVRGESFDIGFNLIHGDHQAHPLIVHGPPVNGENHGASTIGICFGDGTGSATARGLLPDGQGIVADVDGIGTTGPNRYNHSAELLQPPYRAVFQTSSIGSNRTTQYTTISADTDQMLFDLDLVHCQSQSNAGTRNSRPQAWAKNIISGGGILHRNTLDKADDCWCGQASIGPAADGRVKPTFTHFYDLIFTTSCCGPTSYTSNFGGTSGATPIICGHVGIFFQMWADGIFDNPVFGSDVFANRSHMTTAKAMLVNSAEQYDFSGPTDDRTRVHQGWGMPDLQKLYDMRDKLLVVDETDILEPFDAIQYVVTVTPGEPALKATMTYADLPGNPGVQTQHRINDLDLKVTSPSSTTYYGNEGLMDAPWSIPGGAPDTKNTVENVFIQDPEAGVWIVEVSAPEIIQDSHVETPVLDADYALVVSGIASQTSVGAPEVTSAATAEELALRIQGLSPGTVEARLFFQLEVASEVRLLLYDLRGRLIATVHDGVLPAGAHAVAWNGRDRNGQSVGAGVYFARLEAGSLTTTGKLVVVR